MGSDAVAQNGGKRQEMEANREAGHGTNYQGRICPPRPPMANYGLQNSADKKRAPKGVGRGLGVPDTAT